MLKVLFVDSTVIGEKSATGATLVNMTKAIHDCDFLQYCIDYDSRFHTPYYPTLFEKRSDAILFSFIKSVYRKKYTSLSDNDINADRNTSLDENMGKFASVGRLLLDILPHRVGPSTLKRIKEYDPDVIYALGSSITKFSVLESLEKQLNIPIVIHFMDDWYNSKYTEYRETLWGHTLLQKRANMVIKNTSVNIAISEKMASYYNTLFHKQFYFAMNCIDEIHYVPEIKREKILMLFSGGLHGGRAQTIKTVAEIISKDERLSNCIELEIYTSQEHIRTYSTMLSPYCILKEYVNENSLFNNLSRANVLLHVESFEKRYVNFYRYSLSTKIPEYLSVGRPIFCVGPKDNGTVSYIENKSVGFTANTISSIKSVLYTIITNEDLRDEYGKNAVELAKQKHTTEATARILSEVFHESCNKPTA